jgi:hypothetical protein
MPDMLEKVTAAAPSGAGHDAEGRPVGGCSRPVDIACCL